MSIIIPQSLPNKATKGEARLYHILADKLDDNFYVWYEPRIDSKHPDFIILSPDFGLLIIEVKGWYPNQILKVTPDTFQIKSETESEYVHINNQKSPLRQAKDYLDLLINKLQQYSILTQPTGKYQGRLAFPIGWGVVMSNITLEQAKNINLSIVLPQSQVAYRDELLAWETNQFNQANLLNRLRQMFTVNFPFQSLTRDQISTIQGVIYPEFVIRSEPANINSVRRDVSDIPNNFILQTLDHKQQELAQAIGSGHRVFFGVAGSGKTLLLIARSKILINQNPQAKILVMCFNISLAAYLKSLLHQDHNNPQYQQIQVTNFDGWAKSILGKLPAQTEGNRDEYTAKLVLEKLESYTTQEKWDAILIDEAHTFVPSWFKCCVKALKDSENSDLMIVADGSQSLYKRADFQWKDVGIKAQGRTFSKKFDLDKNYRNTQEIIGLAWELLSEFRAKIEILEDDDITFPAIQLSQTLRHGLLPKIYVTSSSEKQISTVIQTIETLIKKGCVPDEIAILYRQVNQNEKTHLKTMMSQLETLEISSYWVTRNDQTKANYSKSQAGVRIITCLSALGLEFKNVLILWLDQFDDCMDRKQSALLASKQLYVAMTRAQENLFIFSSETAKLLPKLQSSNYCEIINIG